ncbi:MAG: helix-turn-helix transcriptional regulator [Oscillospiraceae bacterium]|nr:helix-turn-helix transcriptional regulator [Oscillospiraceae bacterium]
MTTKMIYPNLGAELARRQMTQEKLAELLHIDSSTISLKLTGKRGITLNEAREIKIALGVNMSLDELFDTNAIAN